MDLPALRETRIHAGCLRRAAAPSGQASLAGAARAVPDTRLVQGPTAA